MASMPQQQQQLPIVSMAQQVANTPVNMGQMVNPQVRGLLAGTSRLKPLLLLPLLVPFICLIAGSAAPETTDDAVDATAKTPSAAAAAPPGSAAVPNVSRRNDDSPWTAAGSWRNEPASATTDGSPTAGLGN